MVSRITAILSTFLSGESHSVTEIARLTGLPVSTTHRLVADLASRQLLRRVSDGQYEVGLTLQRLGGHVGSLPALCERAPQVVADLCEVTHRRARLGVLRGDRVAYIEKRVGPEPPTSFCPAATLPAHATALGKALLAFSPTATLLSVEKRLTAYTPHTLIRSERLRRALREIRLTGTAVACGELFPDDRAVAVPVFGSGGVALAALELDVHDMGADLEMCRAALVIAARGLSRELAVEPQPTGRPRLRLLPRPVLGGHGAAPALSLPVTAAP